MAEQSTIYADIHYSIFGSVGLEVDRHHVFDRSGWQATADGAKAGEADSVRSDFVQVEVPDGQAAKLIPH